MAFSVSLALDLTFRAGADLSTKQFHIVELTGQDTVNVCDAATDKPLGILQNKPKVGEAAIVRVWGISKVVAGDVLTAGADYGTSAAGQAVAKVTAGDLVLGRVLEGTAAAGNLATVTVSGLSLAKV